MVVTQPPQTPTRGQLERTLSQRIQAFYRNQLGQQPSKVTCQLFDYGLAIILENSITLPEKRLAEHEKIQLAETVHSNLDKVIKPQLQALIEEILQVSVLDLFTDAGLETGRTGILAVLADVPQVRNPESIPKLSTPQQ
ncbi:MAG: hypothetical protein BRC39_11360 [Cyanobacteria bacterium QH_7_48_89]|nr:MAG: hypothetical protein BRC39_11360 [Cyanobacteria bacterium QH_7_48_89]